MLETRKVDNNKIRKALFVFRKPTSIRYVHQNALSESDYVTFGSLLSQICLSSVVPRDLLTAVSKSLVVPFVRPTQGVEPVRNISSPLCTLAILWPCKILRRSSKGNPSPRSVKRKRGITTPFSTFCNVSLFDISVTGEDRHFKFGG